jgi:UDP:flavonoid glycosyltransferase YjiC (YdhE family)
MLFTFAGGNGHFEPLIPIARAARAAGHLVAVAGRPAMTETVERAGFTSVAVAEGGSWPDVAGKTARLPLLELDADREDRVLREGFAGRIARRRAAGLIALAADWRPDLVVRDEIDFGAAVAAERLGIPHVTVLVVAAGSFVRPEVVAEPLHQLRAEHGLAPDPELEMLRAHLVLSPFAPSFRDPAFPLPDTAHSIRPAALESPVDTAAPAWIAELDGAPTIYFSLGTVFNVESGDLFGRVLAGLRDLGVGLVVTVGNGIDPVELGPQPAHVHIERYVSQARILPSCELVVSHAGSGSVTGALAHGLPLVLLPMGADQPLNAARCAELGVGTVLDAVRVSSREVQHAASAVIADPGCRRAAERLRDEGAALPTAAEAVALLEELVAR